MGDGARSVYTVGVECSSLEVAKFEGLYSDQNQDGSYRSNYPRQGDNKGWYRDEGFKDKNMNRGIKIPTGMIGRWIGMCLLMIAKSQKILKVAIMSIWYFVSLEKLKGFTLV